MPETTAPPATRPEYLTIQEVAELLRTPVQTLYNWRHQRKGPPSYRVGRKVLYIESEVVAWVADQAAA